MLKYFIIGAVLATLGISVLNSITELIISFIELLKAHISVQIMKCNSKIQELQADKNNTRAIGFALSEEEYDDEGY
jgi:hypothetical protein